MRFAPSEYVVVRLPLVLLSLSLSLTLTRSRSRAFAAAPRRYKTLVEGTTVYMHPSSSLFNNNPQWVIYHELVLTTKEYMRSVCAIDPKWLIELAPKFFKKGDARHLSRRKRQEKIEPLFDRFNEPDMWRLSKRIG